VCSNYAPWCGPKSRPPHDRAVQLPRISAPHFGLRGTACMGRNWFRFRFSKNRCRPASSFAQCECGGIVSLSKYRLQTTSSRLALVGVQGWIRLDMASLGVGTEEHCLAVHMRNEQGANTENLELESNAFMNWVTDTGNPRNWSLARRVVSTAVVSGIGFVRYV
jgi:hypothetical protein